MLPGGWRDGREHGAGGALTNRRERAEITGKMQHSVSPLLCSAPELAGKVVFAHWIVPAAGYTAVCVCEPVTWVVCAAFISGACIMHRREFQKL